MLFLDADTDTRVRIFDKSVCISHSDNTPRKSRNLSIFPSDIGNSWADWLFNFLRQPDKEKENWIKTRLGERLTPLSYSCPRQTVTIMLEHRTVLVLVRCTLYQSGWIAFFHMSLSCIEVGAVILVWYDPNVVILTSIFGLLCFSGKPLPTSWCYNVRCMLMQMRERFTVECMISTSTVAVTMFFLVVIVDSVVVFCMDLRCFKWVLYVS